MKSRSAKVLGGIWVVLLSAVASAAAPAPEMDRSPILLARAGGPGVAIDPVAGKAGGANASGGGGAGVAPSPSQPKAEIKLDAVAFFKKVVDHYHHINSYKDTARVVQVTQREGAESSRVETSIACEIADGKLHVETPSSQLRGSLGLNLPVKSNQRLTDAKLRYDLWLAPHMAMKFTDEPLKDLRAGVDEGFTATKAESVTIDNKKLVHVSLRSGDGLSEDCAAKFDLYINSESMLIERIDGEQKLPDGASYSTTLHITPGDVDGSNAAQEPAA